MKISRPWVLMVLIPLLVGLMLTACQKTETPVVQQAKPAPPPPPPPPPETSQGKLVRVDRAEKIMVHVLYLTTEGLRADERWEKAGKDKAFLILHFEGKSKVAEPKLWLTDTAGKKYDDWYGYSKKKGESQIAFRIPADAKELVWHDGKKKSYRLEPVPVEIAEPAQATTATPPAKTQ